MWLRLKTQEEPNINLSHSWLEEKQKQDAKSVDPHRIKKAPLGFENLIMIHDMIIAWWEMCMTFYKSESI